VQQFYLNLKTLTLTGYRYRGGFRKQIQGRF